MLNLTETSSPWDTPIEVPEPGEKVKAAPDFDPIGSIRAAFQKLANRTAGLVLGGVSLKRVYSDRFGKNATPAGVQDGDIYALNKLVADNTTDIPLGRADLTGRKLAFTTVTAGSDGSNPPRMELLQNELRALNTPKAWAYLTTDVAGGGTIIMEDGCNIAAIGPVFVAGQNRIRFAFAGALKDAKYSVVPVASRDAGATFIHAWPRDKTTTTFDIAFDVDPRTVPIYLDLHVFGRQNS